ncbi:glycosyltransferase family 4 protein [Confluentibacter flavum]|uniref:Glycosyl transferase family 1 domain-containing protein n=1 Tax=Confluentibacter flavum TaxID=1909700 RepID=A0A2N3HPG2_9FLAO|nr:glycosyltransferase family 4 protein [Confluentibacter flavum]PKQ46738.1 hypothetical protein CSW08_01695 [Confluentibacter flavum]
MKKPITVAIYSGVSKSTTFIERLIKGLIESHVKVLVFGVDNGKSFYSESVKYYTYRGKVNKLFRLCKYTLLLSLFKPKDKKRLDEIIKANTHEPKYLLRLKYYPVLFYKPDIFHLQWAKSIEDWVWVQEFGMKLVVSLRGTHITISPIGNDYWADLYTHLFPQVDGFHAVSKSMSLEAQKYRALPSKIKIIYSGLLLDDMMFLPKTVKKEPLKILSVGRSHWTKGYHHALDAMKLLKERHIYFHYTIIGVDDDEELLFQRSQLDIENDVTFKSELPFEAVLKSIQAVDVLLLPSLEEGIANVVLEAMALGTLVVSTDCGGMDEVIKDKENGFLIPIRNPSEMASAIQNVSQLTLDDYSKLTKAARVSIEQQHHIKKMIVDMKALYHGVLNDKL